MFGLNDVRISLLCRLCSPCLPSSRKGERWLGSSSPRPRGKPRANPPTKGAIGYRSLILFDVLLTISRRHTGPMIRVQSLRATCGAPTNRRETRLRISSLLSLSITSTYILSSCLFNENAVFDAFAIKLHFSAGTAAPWNSRGSPYGERKKFLYDAASRCAWDKFVRRCVLLNRGPRMRYIFAGIWHEVLNYTRRYKEGIYSSSVLYKGRLDVQ